MKKKIVYFGYISFLREQVDKAKQLMATRPRDYLYPVFDPMRMMQDGPGNPYPNYSFSIVFDSDDMDETVAEIGAVIASIPFDSAVLVVDDEVLGLRKVYRMHAPARQFIPDEMHKENTPHQLPGRSA